MKKNYSSLFSYLIIGFITVYQLFFFFRKPSCRFFPTCSEYAKEAFETHDVLSATKLTVIRLLSCRPFGKSGVDCVPKSIKKGVTRGY